MRDQILVVLVGPTAVGKTALGIELAQAFQTEIVSADARQCYKELTIGTAKPNISELETVRHHLVGSHSIHDELTAGHFAKEALQAIDRICAKNRYCLLVGGSGLYVKAVCQGLDAIPKAPLAVRESLNRQFESEGLEPLIKLLKEKDPTYFAEVDLRNPQRIIRALEVSLATGQPYSSYRKGKPIARPFQIIKIGLRMDREQLYDRIDRRVDQMIASGLVDEVRSLEKYKNANPLQTVGYQEIFGHLEHRYDLQEAIDLLKKNTRRYAKRQYTWFNRDHDIQWFEREASQDIIAYIKAKAG